MLKHSRKCLPEPPDSAETGPKLRTERGPADLYVLLEGMQPIGEPYINIDDHGSGTDCPQCGFGQRHWMLVQCAIKMLVE